MSYIDYDECGILEIRCMVCDTIVPQRGEKEVKRAATSAISKPAHSKIVLNRSHVDIWYFVRPRFAPISRGSGRFDFQKALIIGQLIRTSGHQFVVRMAKGSVGTKMRCPVSSAYL